MTPAIALCIVIVVLDALQVVFLGKGAGAIGGALLYTAFAAGMASGRPRAETAGALGAVLLPLLPTSILFLGMAPPAGSVDRPMVGVYAVQVAAAVAASGALLPATQSKGTAERGTR